MKGRWWLKKCVGYDSTMKRADVSEEEAGDLVKSKLRTRVVDCLKIVGKGWKGKEEERKVTWLKKNDEHLPIDFQSLFLENCHHV